MTKTCKFALVIVAGMFILFSFVAVFLWPRDIIGLKFDTYQMAVESGAIDKEWLPGFLPQSAKNINSTSNLDSNTELVSFTFGPDFDKFIATQQVAPPRTAESLGIRGHSERFGDARELTYIPKISLDGVAYPGALLINRTRREALYQVAGQKLDSLRPPRVTPKGMVSFDIFISCHDSDMRPQLA